MIMKLLLSIISILLITQCTPLPPLKSEKVGTTTLQVCRDTLSPKMESEYKVRGYAFIENCEVSSSITIPLKDFNNGRVWMLKQDPDTMLADVVLADDKGYLFVRKGIRMVRSDIRSINSDYESIDLPYIDIIQIIKTYPR